MEQWIDRLMHYPGIVFLMALENIFPPIPSELIMPLAGYKSAQGDLNIFGAVLAGVIGSLIGQTILYYLGWVVGEERLKQWTAKYGEWLALAPTDIDKSKEWFERHGNRAALLGRMVPGIRSLVSLPAGLAHMPLPKFLLYSGIGTSIWTAILGTLGYFLGERYQGIGQYIGIGSKIILGVMAAYFVFQVIKRKREKALVRG